MSSRHREIVPLGIAVAYAINGGICQSEERRMSGHLYTVAGGYQM